MRLSAAVYEAKEVPKCHGVMEPGRWDWVHGVDEDWGGEEVEAVWPATVLERGRVVYACAPPAERRCSTPSEFHVIRSIARAADRA
jgi:hypothetical protein